MRRVTLLLILLPAIAAGQEIRLDGPGEPIQPREYCQVLVSGLSDADLPGATVDWSPREGTTCMPARLWGGQPFLLFSGKQPGLYRISVTTNAWRGNLDASVDAARRAGTIDPETLARLVTVQSDLAARYPLRTGTCDVEVAGVPPPPTPPDPGPDPPPATKVTAVTYVHEKDQNHVPRGVASALQSLNAAGSCGVCSEFEEDTLTGTGQVPAQYRVALEAARKAGLPALVVQAGDQVLRVVRDPQTESDVQEAVQ
jgi:hypothetical protein